MISNNVLNHIKSYSADPTLVNRLIVSAFLHSLEIQFVKNIGIKRLMINKGDSDYDNFHELLQIEKITSLEDLIELFEFVISPERKIVNGAVYTPPGIREYITDNTVGSINQSEDITICDPACGCAGFLLSAAIKLKAVTNRTYKEIFRSNLFGLDIEDYSIERSEILLTLLAISEGEDEEEFTFNLHIGDALEFNWHENVDDFQGFDIVVGNPPYVCSRNMEKKSLDLIYNWEVSRSGHPDLYIPFFQIGFEILKEGGMLGFITVNTFLKSINGRALREYFSRKQVDMSLINFGGEQIFHGRNTYTCLCFLINRPGGISYLKTTSSSLIAPDLMNFVEYDYEELNNHDGWNLVNSRTDWEFINRVESTGTPFKELYETRNGIATLKNHIYKFIPTAENDDAYSFITKEGRVYEIERSICREVVNSNRIYGQEDLINNHEQIIFPYRQVDGQVLIIEKDEMIASYPLAYQYLLDHSHELKQRDKGAREYEEWYAYGRRQSLDINAYKLFFPHISERPNFVISEDRELLFYNGIAVVSENLEELAILKKIMESDLFFRYVRATTKDYSSGYISMSKNYIKNFGVAHLSEEQKHDLLTVENPNEYLERIYLGEEREEEQELRVVAEPRVNYD